MTLRIQRVVKPEIPARWLDALRKKEKPVSIGKQFAGAIEGEAEK